MKVCLKDLSLDNHIYANVTEIHKKCLGGLGLEVHICHPGYSEGEDRRIMVQDWPSQKAEALSQKKAKRAGGVAQ
jgi:hypothetical protein